MLVAVYELHEKCNKPTFNSMLDGGKHNVGFGTLQRASKREPTWECVLDASDGRGRRRLLIADEENIIKYVAIEFQRNGPQWITILFLI